jgi:hypothetical protein
MNMPFSFSMIRFYPSSKSAIDDNYGSHATSSQFRLFRPPSARQAPFTAHAESFIAKLRLRDFIVRQQFIETSANVRHDVIRGQGPLCRDNPGRDNLARDNLARDNLERASAGRMRICAAQGRAKTGANL